MVFLATELNAAQTDLKIKQIVLIKINSTEQIQFYYYYYY